MRNKLTPTAIHKTKRVGYHSDGGGLYLRVTRAGTRSWIFRWRDSGRLRDCTAGQLQRHFSPPSKARYLALRLSGYGRFCLP